MMNRRRRRQRRGESAVELPDTFWMISFSDLLTLLITFFVMRVATGTVDPQRLQAAVQAVSLTEQSALPSPEERLKEVLADYDGALRYGDKPEAAAPGVAGAPEFQVASRSDGTLLLLGGNTFETGSDLLSEQARSMLVELANVFRDEKGQIEIAGHTDNIPIFSQRFASNWELSTARAISVAHVLLDQGVHPERISVVGYADTKPLVPNISAANRAENRRVEVLMNK